VIDIRNYDKETALRHASFYALDAMTQMVWGRAIFLFVSTMIRVVSKTCECVGAGACRCECCVVATGTGSLGKHMKAKPMSTQEYCVYSA
jgi:hypothetical protein